MKGLARLALLPLLLLAGCTSTLTLDYRPEPGRPLNIAGLRELRYGVEVVDSRNLRSPRDIGHGKRFLWMRPRLLSERDVSIAVLQAVVRELQSFDLEVTAPEKAHVVLRVVVLDLEVDTRGAGGFPVGQTAIRSSAEALVLVRENRTGETTVEAPIDLRVEFESPSSIVDDDRYEESINDALGELARRVVHHPDVLIAVQGSLSR